MAIWVNSDGKILMNDEGKVYVCDTCPCVTCCLFPIDLEHDDQIEDFDDQDMPPSIFVTMYNPFTSEDISAVWEKTGFKSYKHPLYDEYTLEPTADGWKLVAPAFVAYSKCFYEDAGAPCQCIDACFTLSGITGADAVFTGSGSDVHEPLDSYGGLTGEHCNGDVFGSWSHNFGTDEEPDTQSGAFRFVYQCNDFDGLEGTPNFLGIALVFADGSPAGVYEGWVYQGNYCKSPNEDGSIAVDNILGGAGQMLGNVGFNASAGYRVYDNFYNKYDVTWSEWSGTVERATGCTWTDESGEHVLAMSNYGIFTFDGREKDTHDGTPEGEYEDDINITPNTDP